jgi:hypothetical protein
MTTITSIWYKFRFKTVLFCFLSIGFTVSQTFGTDPDPFSRKQRKRSNASINDPTAQFFNTDSNTETIEKKITPRGTQEIKPNSTGDNSKSPENINYDVLFNQRLEQFKNNQLKDPEIKSPKLSNQNKSDQLISDLEIIKKRKKKESEIQKLKQAIHQISKINYLDELDQEISDLEITKELNKFIESEIKRIEEIKNQQSKTINAFITDIDLQFNKFKNSLEEIDEKKLTEFITSLKELKSVKQLKGFKNEFKQSVNQLTAFRQLNEFKNSLSGTPLLEKFREFKQSVKDQVDSAKEKIDTAKEKINEVKNEVKGTINGVKYQIELLINTEIEKIEKNNISVSLKFENENKKLEKFYHSTKLTDLLKKLCIFKDKCIKSNTIEGLEFYQAIKEEIDEINLGEIKLGLFEKKFIAYREKKGYKHPQTEEQKDLDKKFFYQYGIIQEIINLGESGYFNKIKSNDKTKDLFNKEKMISNLDFLIHPPDQPLSSSITLEIKDLTKLVQKHEKEKSDRNLYLSDTKQRESLWNENLNSIKEILITEYTDELQKRVNELEEELKKE